VVGLIHHVEEILGRGHGLFGGAGAAGGPACEGGGGLTDAANQLHTPSQLMAGQRGALAAHYRVLTAEAGHGLHDAARTDGRLSRRVRAAGRADSAGWAGSAAAVDGAHADAADLAPLAATPAGQRALIGALRARLSQQQRTIAAARARDARLAATLRSLGYHAPGRRSGRIPLSGGASGGAPGAGRPPARPGGGSPLPVALVGSTHGAALRGVRPSVPGAATGTPLGALTPDSSPRQVAAAIIGEAHRRGYSRHQITAILADALQESNLNPRAQSPNTLWYGIFQQDSSYPGRHNPNLAIAEFFNRLDRHGGPASPDIWKSIFWLQQRPGEPSAQAAFAHGRQAYLREIQRQLPRAGALYRDIVAG
jgi:hypothetical protein